jgi:hypothetical protein
MKKLCSVFLILMIISIAATGTQAALIFDRGLPTANLNNDAGSNRSNVMWAFGADSNGQWLAGDDFTLSNTGNYYVETISVWSTSSTGSLWLGANGGTITNLGTASSSTLVTYPGTSLNYETSTAGTFRDIYQLTFTVNSVLSGGTTYQFFLDGPTTGTSYAYLHSSNAALSGSTQQGSDNYMLAASVLNGTLSNVEQWTSLGNGWDKASDANIQVYGAPVPIPAAVWLLGSGLLGLVGLRRSFRK